MPTIKFSHVDVHFDDAEILRDITLTLSEHRIGIIGANGGGKSTLTRLINGLGEPTSGSVTVDGLEVSTHGKKVRQRVGFVFSDAENQIVMPNVRDDVAFSLRQRKDLRKQLLALAAVLVMEPDILIADEPTTLLDLRNRDRIHKEFARLDQQLIVVTHDLEFLRDFDRVICIDNHRIAADGTPSDVIDFYVDLMRTGGN